MPSTADDRPRVSLLITDLDNTLWDWFDAWFKSFSAMLNRLAAETGIPKEQLEAEIHQVHQRRGTSEYSFLLAELPSLQLRHGGGVELIQRYDDVVHVLNKERKQSTRLYPGVMDTLLTVRGAGIPIIAYTESIEFWTKWRIKRLGLDGVIDFLYSSPDHDAPTGVAVTSLRTKPACEYELKKTQHLPVPKGVLKPDRQILDKILADHDRSPREVIYVGDSLMKDVAMAQDVGVLDVHARYGEAHGHPGYALLQRVSHWTDEDVEREMAIMRRPHVTASYTIDKFSELLERFDFGLNA